MAAAWAATSAVLAWPLRAAAIASGRTPRAADPRCRDKFDCPHRDGFADCVNGRCRCGDAHTYCSHEEADPRHCFDLQSSRDHCGACNHECTGADHDVCCEGQCGEFGQTRCNCGGGEPCPGEHDVCGEGIDPGTYFCFNCADFGWQRCGNECADPKTHRCCGNKIYSKDKLPPGDWRCCGPEDRRQLVNVQENEQHCGSCNKRCPEGQFCFGGRCRTRCPSGLKRCGNTCGDARRHTCCHGKLYAKADRVRECKGRCISTKSDQKNCGDCGRKCNGPFDTGECCNGKCCDINADTCCPGGCKNLDHDEGNCGGCGNICVPPMKCRFGTCYCPPGENCN